LRPGDVGEGRLRAPARAPDLAALAATEVEEDEVADPAEEEQLDREREHLLEPLPVRRRLEADRDAGALEAREDRVGDLREDDAELARLGRLRRSAPASADPDAGPDRHLGDVAGVDRVEELGVRQLLRSLGPEPVEAGREAGEGEDDGERHGGPAPPPPRVTGPARDGGGPVLPASHHRSSYAVP